MVNVSIFDKLLALTLSYKLFIGNVPVTSVGDCVDSKILVNSIWAFCKYHEIHILEKVAINACM